MTHLALTFPGSFQATLGGEPLAAFRSAEGQALLIYLALGQRQAHPREVLAALLWPEEPESVARTGAGAAQRSGHTGLASRRWLCWRCLPGVRCSGR